MEVVKMSERFLACRATAQHQILEHQHSIDECRARVNSLQQDILRELTAMKVPLLVVPSMATSRLHLKVTASD
jgi:hypothetical protein